MKRRHICDVPGCNSSRARYQRLCDACFYALPRDIRTALINAHRQGRRTDWRRECRFAGEYFDGVRAHRSRPQLPAPSPSRNRLTAEQAFDQIQRQLGER